MSLTSILKNDPDVKYWFKTAFKSPGFKESLELLVEPAQTNGSYAGLIGGAFDYVMRFYLQFINPSTVTSRKWVAEQGLGCALTKIESSPGKEIVIGYNYDRRVNKKMFVDQLVSNYKRAQDDYADFVRSGNLTEAIVESAIFLAKLDIVYRTGIIDAKIDSIEPEKTEELKFLFICVPWEEFRARHHCVLNPTFGKGSALVGGADADVIIDDTLIDIKTTRHLKLQREDLSQVIGYYLLSRIGDVDNANGVRINNIGIYFARYGYLWKYNLFEYYTEQAYAKAVEDFVRLIKGKRATLNFLAWDI